MTIPDLWPDDLNEKSNLIMPLTILREQAAALSQRTNGLVEGYVHTVKAQNGAAFEHTFFLVAPSLDNYSVPLLSISHPLGGYPATVRSKHLATAIKASSDKGVVALLRKIFSDPRTKKIVQALIAQSKS